jgi:hypothetical protein
MTRRPEDVFTPKTIASREMFARRNEPDLLGIPGLQDRLTEALSEQGGQVLVYGDTGVGKSSLVRYAAEDAGLQQVNIECFSNKSYEDLIEDGIRKLVETREVRRTSTTSVGAEAEGGVKVKFLLSFKAKVKGEHATGREIEVVEKPPLDALLDAMQASGTRLFVLDNFQNITDDRTRLLVAQTMEALSDRSAETGDIKAVVIGIADDAAGLLGGSVSFLRRTTEVGVPRMPDDEVEEVFRTGFGLLDLSTHDELLLRLVFFADGFPYFAHLLGLYASRMARREQHSVISEADVDRGIAQAVQQVNQTLSARLEKALEKAGDTQPRRRIVQLMANSNRREWQITDVVEAYRAKYGERDDYTFLHVAFGLLVKPEYGNILKRNEARKPYVSRFTDPQMRPYLRLNPVC